MIVVARVLTGVLLLAHGLVHLLYLAPDLPAFSLEKSWLVPEVARRSLGLVLIAATAVAFALVALAVWGVPGLSTAWSTLTVVACVLSAVLLLLYWNLQLVFGLAIDAALFVVAVMRPAWAEQLIGAGE